MPRAGFNPALLMRSREIAAASGILMASFVASRLLGLARDMVLSYLFGTSADLAAYVAAFRVPDLLFQILAGAAVSTAVIPVLSGYFAKGEEEDAWRVASSALTLVAVVTSLISLAAVLAAPLYVPLLVPGFAAEQKELVVGLTRIMLVTPFFFGISSTATGILNAKQDFLWPALAPLVYNLAIIAAALALSPVLGIHSLALGVAAGSAFHLAAQGPGLVRAGLRYRPAAEIGHPAVRQIATLTLPRTFGLAAVQANFVVNTILASTLASYSLPALNYAWLLMMMPLGIFGMAISTAAFPTLAEYAAQERTEELRQTILATLRVILFLVVPASVGLVILREPLIGLLFERGRFDTLSTQATAFALLFYSLGLSAHAALEILNRGFYALQNTVTPVAVAVGGVIVNIALSLLLMRYLAHGGLALALSSTTVAESIVLFLLLSRRLSLLGRAFFAALAKIALASSGMGALLFLYLAALTSWGGPMWGSRAVLVFGGIAIGAGAYLLCTLLLGLEEPTTLIGKARPRWLRANLG